MTKTLLLTGWGLPVYAPAAALAYQSREIGCQADIEAVSQRYLPKVLREVGGSYAQIFILGVGLTAAPDETAAAVLELRQKNTEVIWVSDRAIPREIATAFQTKDGDCCFSQVFGGKDGGKDLLDVVAESFACTKEDLRHFRPFASDRVRGTSDSARYRKLFEAADWRHKTYRDYASYPAAIRLLANRVSPASWPPEMNEIVALFDKWGKRQLLGESVQMKEVRRLIKLAAKHDEAGTRVFITGPSGTGKETVAQQIHMLSSRKQGPFMSFNCACTTRGLFESKLFGHTADAYTGSRKEEPGLFALAAHGTLFLDEIAELDPILQGYLLRVLQDGEYQMVGSNTINKVEDVRIITATNRDLVQLVREGRFREDLYWRLRVMTLAMCGLADRPDDIAPIADGLWYRENKEHLTAEQLAALKDYSYPGNARELENMLAKARALEITDFSRLVDEQRRENAGLVNESPTDTPSHDWPVDATLEEVKLLHIRRAHAHYKALGYSQKRIASLLGIAENSLKKYL